MVRMSKGDSTLGEVNQVLLDLITILLGTGQQAGNLTTVLATSTRGLTPELSKNPALWHQRLGHP